MAEKERVSEAKRNETLTISSSSAIPSLQVSKIDGLEYQTYHITSYTDQPQNIKFTPEAIAYSKYWWKQETLT